MCCKNNDIIYLLDKLSFRNRKLLIESLLLMHEQSLSINQDNEKAYAALLVFFKSLKEISVDRKYIVYRSHLSYIINLQLINLSMMSGNYCDACREVISLFAAEPVMQKRIYVNLLSVLGKYIE